LFAVIEKIYACESGAFDKEKKLNLSLIEAIIFDKKIN